MSRRFLIAISLAWCGLALLITEVSAADSTETEPATFVDQARQYQLTVDGKDLSFREQPLLHWANPARNGEDGSVFLWTLDEKPIVVGTCFTYVYSDNVNRKHAFSLLTDDAVQAQHLGRELWNPARNRIVYRPFGDAVSVGATAAQRSTQLRQIARHFSVTLTLKDGRTEQCRLVPQPLYRFDSDELSGACGAIFSFAVGTDPEALLVLDRRVDDSGSARWHYGFARFTFYPLEGFKDGESVWKLEQMESMSRSILARPDYQREAYITFSPKWLD